MVLISAIVVFHLFKIKIFKYIFQKFYKLYVDNIDYYYLKNAFLNPQNKFRLFSQLSEKISNVEIHTFWGSGQVMESYFYWFPIVQCNNSDNKFREIWNKYVGYMQYCLLSREIIPCVLLYSFPSAIQNGTLPKQSKKITD